VPQIAIAWLLRRSPFMLPIPGTTNVEHLHENLAALTIDLTTADVDVITELVPESPEIGNEA
jgi:pyridoxine 4-dehydrogenase